MAKSLLLGILLLLAVSQIRAVDCVAGEVISVKDGIVRCVPCPKNCFSCVEDSTRTGTVCLGCHNSHFITPDGQCQPCVDNCEVCYGPGIDKCMMPKSGFVYNSEYKALMTCPIGCSACSPGQDCIRCQTGFRTESLLNADSTKKVHDGHELVKCVPCASPNCMYCEVNEFKVESCTHCNREFGINPATKKCDPCPAGCMTCHTNSQICNYCKEGFQKNFATGNCEPISLQNCMNFDTRTQECSWCKLGYMVDPATKKSCIPCSGADPYCNGCRLKTEQEKVALPNPAVNLVCTVCSQRFSLNPITHTCKYCGDHCQYCDANSKCLACDLGFLPNASGEGCVKSKDIPNCEIVGINGLCSTCRVGYFLDKASSQCLQCHESCLICSGQSEKDCVSCPANRYMLKVPVEQNFFMSIFVRSQVRCVTSCPSSEGSIQYRQDEYFRECVQLTEEEIKAKKPKSKYPFARTSQGKNWETMYHDAVEYVVQLANFKAASTQSAKDWAAANPEEAKEFSKHCNYRGFLEEKVSSDRETVYQCDCLKGFHGVNCFMDKEMYEAIQEYITIFAIDLSTMTGAANEEKIYKIFSSLCHGMFNLDTLGLMTIAFDRVMQSQFAYKATDLPAFMAAADGLMRIHYIEKIDLENSLTDSRNDIDTISAYNVIYRELNRIIDVVNKVAAASIPNSAPFAITPTMSIQASLTTTTGANFGPGKNEGSGFKVSQSDIFNQGKNTDILSVFINDAELRSKADTGLKVLLTVYSNLLFRKDKETFASQLLSIQISDKGGNQLMASSSPSNFLTIIFPVKHLPATEDVKSKLKCVMVRFEKDGMDGSYLIAEIAAFGTFEDTGKPFVECRFAQYDFGKVFYSVGHIGKHALTKDAETTKITRKALDDNDSFQLSHYQAVDTTSANILTLGMNFMLGFLGLSYLLAM
jgi:hypothetical protein